jgi:hypothetical protein
MISKKGNLKSTAYDIKEGYLKSIAYDIKEWKFKIHSF